MQLKFGEAYEFQHKNNERNVYRLLFSCILREKDRI